MESINKNFSIDGIVKDELLEEKLHLLTAINSCIVHLNVEAENVTRARDFRELSMAIKWIRKNAELLDNEALLTIIEHNEKKGKGKDEVRGKEDK